MAVKNPKELFLILLSDARQNTEKAAKVFQELGQAAQNPDVKEALETRSFVAGNTLGKIDQCFKLLGEEPVKLSGKLQEVFVEDFRKELGEIQNPAARHLFVLAKAIHLAHFRIAEFAALTAAADLTGHYGVGVLLESCLAEKLAFVERTRRLLRKLAENKLAEKLAA